MHQGYLVIPKEWFEKITSSTISTKSEAIREARLFTNKLFGRSDADGIIKFFEEAYLLVDPKIRNALVLPSIAPFESGMNVALEQCVDVLANDPSINLVAYEYYYDAVVSSSGLYLLSDYRPGDPQSVNSCKLVAEIEGPEVFPFRHFDYSVQETPVEWVTHMYCEAHLVGAYLRSIERLGKRSVSFHFDEHDTWGYILEVDA